jgi:hypothetical protein
MAIVRIIASTSLSNPATVHMKLLTQDMPPDRLKGRIEEITRDHLTRFPS